MGKRWLAIVAAESQGEICHSAKLRAFLHLSTGGLIWPECMACHDRINWTEEQEKKLAPEATFFNSCCQMEREALPRPDRPLVVGIDGGYVRHWHKKACFEIIIGKSMPDEKPAKCFGFVQDYDLKPRRRVFEVLQSQGLQANQSVEFFTDGAPTLRSLTTYLNPESTHILDWFHLTMRITVLQQYAMGLTKVDEQRGKEVTETLTSVKWHLWHGNVERALEKIDDLDVPLINHGADKSIGRKYDKLNIPEMSDPVNSEISNPLIPEMV